MPELDPAEEARQYPVGRFQYAVDRSPAARERATKIIEQFPLELGRIAASLSREQWEMPYRPGGWTPRQVVHHVADSHMNGFIRWKAALTEQVPTIKPYDEKLWAEQSDVAQVDPTVSLELLRALHTRWSAVIRSLDDASLERKYRNPESDKVLTLWESLALYAWHCTHHLAHVSLVQQQLQPDAAGSELA